MTREEIELELRQRVQRGTIDGVEGRADDEQTDAIVGAMLGALEAHGAEWVPEVKTKPRQSARAVRRARNKVESELLSAAYAKLDVPWYIDVAIFVIPKLLPFPYNVIVGSILNGVIYLVETFMSDPATFVALSSPRS